MSSSNKPNYKYLYFCVAEIYSVFFSEMIMFVYITVIDADAAKTWDSVNGPVPSQSHIC